MLATPLRSRDLVLGTLGFVTFRVASTCAVFMLVLAPFGVFETWWGALLAYVVQVLVGTAFGSLVYAMTTRLDNPEGFGAAVPARASSRCSCSPARSSRSRTSATSAPGWPG